MKLSLALLTASIMLISSATSFAKPIDFSHQIVPILKKHCVKCHGGDEAKGGFSVNTRELFLESDAAVPGNPQKSYFLELVTTPDPEVQMPPFEEERVSQEEIKLLKQWVTEQMPWEPGFTFGTGRYEPPLLPQQVIIPAGIPGRDHPIDRIIDSDLQARQTVPPKQSADEVFVRRVYLDLIGLLPTPQEREEFLNDKRPDKRDQLIVSLLDRKIDYADHWLTFWNDLLRNDYTGTGFITGGRKQISGWLYRALLENRPYNQLVTELIAPPTVESRGFIDGIKWRGEVSAGQTIPIQFSQSVSQSFLGINMKCASCHDSFIDRWTLQDAYGLAAIYADTPLDIHRCDKPTGEQATPRFVFEELGNVDPDAARDQRLQQLAKILTSEQNGRFARTIVNRLWSQLMGRGIVHPVDAMQTAPWNEMLLEHLAQQLVADNYDIKKILQHILTSQAYQAEIDQNYNEEVGEYTYNGPLPRRLTAEQFMDSVWEITQASPSAIDAPVERTLFEGDYSDVQMQAKWIWGPSAAPGKVPAAGETIMLRKRFELDSLPQKAFAAFTCDNEAIVYVNGREVSRTTDWTKPVSFILLPHLKVGANQIVVRALNAGSSPNSAGFLFEGRLVDAEEQTTILVTDESWEWNPNLNQPKEGRLGRVTGEWKPATIVKALSQWTATVQNPIRLTLARSMSNEPIPMARAALMKNNAFLTALGRPNRDQIVTSRPQQLSTLEAIHLTNGGELTSALSTAAARLQSQFRDRPQDLIQELYLAAYSREPHPVELQTIKSEWGENPSGEQIEDLLWALFLSPEFLYVR